MIEADDGIQVSTSARAYWHLRTDARALTGGPKLAAARHEGFVDRSLRVPVRPRLRGRFFCRCDVL